MYTAEQHKANLEKIRSKGIATGVRIIVPRNACPVCKHFEGGYKFDNEANRPMPTLPLEGCSEPGGSNAFYTPILDLRGP